MLASLSLVLLVCGAVRAADWPMYRFDAGRTAASPGALPDKLDLLWVRRLPPQVPAWRDEAVMKFDRGYEPIVLAPAPGPGGKEARPLLFVGSTTSDTLTAYDLETGEERWRFYTEGPIRVAPAAWKNKVYAASDDGCLYCLEAATGRLAWKFRGGPSERRLIGNERLISTWPARGGPVLVDGTVYFAAGVWPFMGTFIHALDAETGRVVWTSTSTSSTWRRRPHAGSWSFAGLSPQGHLAAVGDRLIVPGSMSNPAVLDRRTGEFLFYGEGSSPQVAAQGRFAVAGGRVFDVATGWAVRLEGVNRLGQAVLAPDAWYTSAGTLDPAGIRVSEMTVQVPETNSPDGPTYPQQVFAGTVRKLAPLAGTAWLRAGSRLIAGGKGGIQMLDVSDPAAPGQSPASPRTVWQGSVAGSVSSVLAAHGKLIVVTAEGSIHCFGTEGSAATGGAHEHTLAARTPAAPAVGDSRPGPWADKAREILKASGAGDGYCMVWGLKDGGLVEELVRQTRLHVIAVDRDAAKVDALRRRLDDAGLYGSRAAALVGEPSAVVFAPYIANLIASEDPAAAGLTHGDSPLLRNGAKKRDSPRGVEFVRNLFHPLRPYGGAACLEVPQERQAEFAGWVKEAGLAGAEVKRAGALALLVRTGALPGSADWCGQNADAGNTRASRDLLVKAPLGVLWFGNALSNSLVLPRHGEGPVEQVAGGRMVIEGPDSLSASDVYTGRLLWTRDFPGLGRFYNITKHQRGAHVIGSNFYTVPDAVYVAAGESCHLLDPATGRTLKELRLPLKAGETKRSDWLFLLVYGDLLIAGSHPSVAASEGKDVRYNTPASSKRLVVMDRRSGEVLWTREAARSFGHYGVVAGRGKVFCVDQVSPEERTLLARRGLAPSGSRSILALDARTGEVAWQSERCVSDQLSYSEEHDILLAAGALRGADGQVLWDRLTVRDYAVEPNPGLDSSADPLWWGKWGPMLSGETIYTQGQRAFDLLTGRQRMWKDARGEQREWRWRRFHGCGPAAGSRHLLTFRSGCAGFYDLAGDGGSGNLGGFRSGCTSNLIVADGVLNAPDYTRTCTCDYQNRSSLGLVHMEDVEYWTFGAFPAAGRAGINFGAPGDRRGEGGTLWLDYPSAGGPSPDVPVKVLPEAVRYYYHHSSRILGGDGVPWVAASGVEGAREIAIEFAPADPARTGRWTVRLHFAEPKDLKAGDRVFGVALQGKEVLKDFDVVKAAGGPNRAVVKEVAGVEAAGVLKVTLAPSGGREPTLLCGVEVVEEKP